MSRRTLRGRGVPVPSGRLSRLARFGGLASGIAGGMAVEGLRRVAVGERPSLEALLMTPANAARFADQLARMRGAAMKVGQLLSMEAGELLPPDLSDILARLRAEADFMPSRQLKSVLSANWGGDFLKRFERFETRPIAAASIGQVHRARARDRRDLAIKVQYPGVRDSIDSDVANVAALIRLSGLSPPGLDIGPLLDEARRQLHEEADYALEARRLERFGALLAGTPGFLTPDFHADLSTRDVLAMTYLDGRAIETLETAPQDERDRVVGALIDLLLRELFEFRMMQTDPNFANYRYEPGTGAIILLDFGATREFAPDLIETYRRFIAAAIGGDAGSLRQAAVEMGYLDEQTSPKLASGVMRMIETGVAPLRAGGLFDFAASCMVETMRRLGMALAEEREVGPIPPVDTLFMHRKVAGLFLLGCRLRARVDVRRRLEAYL